MIYRATVYFHRHTLFGGYTVFKKQGSIKADSERNARKTLLEQAEKLAAWWDRQAYYRNKQSTIVGYIELQEEG